MFTRKLDPQDAQAVSVLVRSGFEAYVAHEWEPQAGRDFVELELSVERLSKMIAESAFTAGTFRDDGTLLGVLILPDPGWLALLFVHPRSFRQGIGRALWNRAREFVLALSPPVTEVRLTASTFATGFYQKLGFTPRETVDMNGRHATRMSWRHHDHPD